MKKHNMVFIWIMLIAIFAAFTFTYVANKSNKVRQEPDDTYLNGRFTVIETHNDFDGSYMLVYANDTGVEYLVITNINRYGITPLYNADGSLQVYEGYNSSEGD